MQQQNPNTNNKHKEKNIKKSNESNVAMKATTTIKHMFKTRAWFMINSPVQFM